MLIITGHSGRRYKIERRFQPVLKRMVYSLFEELTNGGFCVDVMEEFSTEAYAVDFAKKADAALCLALDEIKANIQ